MLLAISDAPWLIVCHCSLYSVITWHSPYVCVSLFFLKGHWLFWLRAHYNSVGPHLNVIASVKTLFLNTVMFIGTRGWDFNILERGHNLTHNSIPYFGLRMCFPFLYFFNFDWFDFKCLFFSCLFSSENGPDFLLDKK